MMRLHENSFTFWRILTSTHNKARKILKSIVCPVKEKSFSETHFYLRQFFTNCSAAFSNSLPASALFWKIDLTMYDIHFYPKLETFLALHIFKFISCCTLSSAFISMAICVGLLIIWLLTALHAIFVCSCVTILKTDLSVPLKHLWPLSEARKRTTNVRNCYSLPPWCFYALQ